MPRKSNLEDRSHIEPAPIFGSWPKLYRFVLVLVGLEIGLLIWLTLSFA